tara:strand:+ start:13 stop:501 length:489 start_codon:yes stop_codon:yes gene_type:complete
MSNNSIDKKIIYGTDTILIKLVMAVRDIESATSPLANLVSTFEVTPPGAAAINITPKASSIGVFNIMIKRNPIIGRTINWQINPTINSFGLRNTLVKSFTVKDAPRPNIINASANGAIVVTIPMTPYKYLFREPFNLLKIYEITRRFKIFRINLALFLKASV